MTITTVILSRRMTAENGIHRRLPVPSGEDCPEYVLLHLHRLRICQATEILRMGRPNGVGDGILSDGIANLSDTNATNPRPESFTTLLRRLVRRQRLRRDSARLEQTRIARVRPLLHR
jgi:hypothetical protein